MTAEQLGKIINKIIYWYGDNEITDKQIDELINLLPIHIVDLLDALDKKEIYFEKSEEYTYVEIDEKGKKYNYEIDYQKSDIKKGQIYLIKKEVPNEYRF